MVVIGVTDIISIYNKLTCESVHFMSSGISSKCVVWEFALVAFWICKTCSGKIWKYNATLMGHLCALQCLV